MGITKYYQDEKILDSIDIKLKKNETICIIGESGIGKTTLFNILSGIDYPDKGKVYLKREDITGKPARVSYMLQKDMLLPFRTVLDNVILPLLIKGENKRSARKKASAYFSKFLLESCQDKYPNQLSGGMRQRAALLRTYLASKEVLLLDEPFSALDSITKQSMYSWYNDIKISMGLSTIFISHDIDEAIMLADKIYILKGKPAKLNYVVCVNRQNIKEPFILSEEFLNYKRKVYNLL